MVKPQGHKSNIIQSAELDLQSIPPFGFQEILIRPVEVGTVFEVLFALDLDHEALRRDEQVSSHSSIGDFNLFEEDVCWEQFAK